jgi:hypothetical protein
VATNPGSQTTLPDIGAVGPLSTLVSSAEEVLAEAAPATAHLHRGCSNRAEGGQAGALPCALREPEPFLRVQASAPRRLLTAIRRSSFLGAGVRSPEPLQSLGV